MKVRDVCRVLAVVLCFTFAFSLFAAVSYATTKGEINTSVKAAMDRFKKQVKGSTEYLKAAKGVLVMPDITKAGLGVGGQYGQGALMVGGKTVGYYSLTAGSVGLQIGAEKFDMVILFMTDEVLKKFRSSSGWEASGDADITVIASSADFTVDTLRSKHQIAGFVFDQKGLMGNVSVKGSKFTKIEPK